MPREAPETLTVAEWKVMKIVWRLKSCAARDVYEEVGRVHGWAPTTTKTVLRRLVDKGHLTATPVGTSHLYPPARPGGRSPAPPTPSWTTPWRGWTASSWPTWSRRASSRPTTSPTSGPC